MNEGYLFLILVWLIFILVVTRWLDPLWASHPRPGRLYQGVMVIILLIMLSPGWYIPLPGATYYSINVSSILLPALLTVYFLWQDQSGLTKHMVAVILFLAVLYAVAYQLFLWDPVLMIMPTLYFFPLLFTLFLILFTRHLPHLWLMLSSGMISGEMLHKLFLLQYIDQVWVGDAAFRDQLAVGLCVVTAVALLLRLGQQTYQQLNSMRAIHGLRRLKEVQWLQKWRRTPYKEEG